MSPQPQCLTDFFALCLEFLLSRINLSAMIKFKPLPCVIILKKTLNESPSISALRRKLNFDLDKGNLPLNSQTRARLREITNEVQKSEAQMDELAEKIINDLPTKSTLSEPLSVNEIKQNIEKWDLTNPNPQDKILISKVQGAELEQLKSEFDFKGNYALAREIEAKNVKHALTRHGDEAVENARGQIAITKDDIADYEKYTQKPDLRVVQDNNRILYAKQVNGYYVVIEEVLSGQNKLQFFDMCKRYTRQIKNRNTKPHSRH